MLISKQLRAGVVAKKKFPKKKAFELDYPGTNHLRDVIWLESKLLASILRTPARKALMRLYYTETSGTSLSDHPGIEITSEQKPLPTSPKTIPSRFSSHRN